MATTPCDITAKDIRLKLIQQGKDLANLTADDIRMAKIAIIDSRVEMENLVGYTEPRASEPNLRSLNSKESVERGIAELEGALAGLKSHSKKWSETLANTFDVQAPIDRAVRDVNPNLPKGFISQTGIKVKGFFGQRELREETGFKVSRNISKDLRYDPDLMYRTVMFAEDVSLFRSAPPEVKHVLAKPVRDTLQFLKDAKGLYASRGVDVDFKGRIERELRVAIDRGLSKNEDVSGLREALKRLDSFEFVHIPAALWFERAAKEGNTSVGNILKVFAEQKRETFSIRDMLKEGLITPDQVNIIDIITNYSRRLGKDLALLDIVNAAKKEGLASSEFKEGFVKPASTAPILKDTWIHPTLNEWILAMTSAREGMNIVEKGIASFKLGQFYVPFILPAYNLKQAIMLGSFKVTKPRGTAKYFIEGMKDSFNHTETYKEALDNGLAATIFNKRWSTYREMAEKIKLSPADKIGKFIIKLPLIVPGVKGIYEASNSSAWLMDRGIRMGSYRWLKDQGFSPQEAAQIAARAHGDYASVPPRTRRISNYLLFTPTFKIVMAKFYGNMVKGAIESMKAVVNRRGELDPKHPLFATAIARTAILLLAIDQLWVNQGYERELFGVRYKRRVDTSEGPKDLVIPTSGPENLPIKFGGRIFKAFQGENISKTALSEFIDSMRWELTPALRMATEIKENRSANGDLIFNPFGESNKYSLKRYGNILAYLVTNGYRLTGAVYETVQGEGSQQEALSIIKKEQGQLMSLATRALFFTYLRSPEEIRIKNRLDVVRSRYEQLLRDEQIKPDDDNIRRLIETIRVILDDIDEEVKDEGSQEQ